MQPRLAVLAVAAASFQFVVTSSQEKCDVYGALVRKPGRLCICSQAGFVRCKPRRGGRFLICVLDLSQLGSDIHDLLKRVGDQKRVFRDYIFGAKTSTSKPTIDDDFDPPDFTMTKRPAIGGGIGDDRVHMGNALEHDTNYRDIDVGGGHDDDDGDDNHDVDEGEYLDGDEETERKMSHKPKKLPAKTGLKNHLNQTARTAFPRIHRKRRNHLDVNTSTRRERARSLVKGNKKKNKLSKTKLKSRHYNKAGTRKAKFSGAKSKNSSKKRHRKRS
ncbi:hypothetical protein GE061_005823 [Apolygus lucorum]|uniref:Uncharacterized protein n=1 Tax=Apolygus lucorum TaxID=248454 RepID=A0A6A4J570_APOLU|nr:hypothetical protein GE061_005823 [Apolygus lucorum]